MHGQSFKQQHGRDLSSEQHKVLSLIQKCNTGSVGHSTWLCEVCRERFFVARTCGNKHCPGCQPGLGSEWLAAQVQKALPVDYFMVTFPLPPGFRKLAKQYPREVYNALFKSAKESLEEGLSRRRWGGLSRIGLTAVLHTWNRKMGYHPHVHCMVPGGGLRSDGKWHGTSSRYLICDKVLSGIYRDKLRENLKDAGLFNQVEARAWSEKFVTNIKENGNGANGMQYLSRYISRTAISNHRINGCVDGKVTYFWYPKGEKQPRERVRGVFAFLMLFLEHVLPRGFQRVRHYGLSHTSSRVTTEQQRQLIIEAAEDKSAMDYRLRRLKQLLEKYESVAKAGKPVPICEVCTSPLVLVSMTYKQDCLGRDASLVFTKLKYRDTG